MRTGSGHGRACSRGFTGYYGPQYDVDGLCAMGAPEECAAYINTYVESGVNLVSGGVPEAGCGAVGDGCSAEVLPLLG